MIILRMMPGGLASQMGQYAVLEKFRLLGARTAFDLQDYKRDGRRPLFNGLELKPIFKLDEREAPRDEIKRLAGHQSRILQKLRLKLKWTKKSFLLEELFTYYPDLFKLRDCYLHGYFGYIAYHADIRPQILETFKFPALDTPNLNVFKKINGRTSVSVHIRRGDYLRSPIFQGCVGAEYYELAIARMRQVLNDPVFMVLSDDLEWCQNNLPLGPDAIYVDWNTKKNSFRDMQLMSLCDHNIIANSGFSFWGAYLGNSANRTVIAPSRWFNDSRFQRQYALPETWTVLPS